MKRGYFAGLSLAALTLLSGVASAQKESSKGQGAAAFEKLKSLAGEWQGQGPHGMTKFSYQIVAGGSAVLETMMPHDEPSMITLYHLDGDRLMLTHYCSSGNQPRMRAEAAAGEIKSLDFTFVDVTNLSPPSAGHMHKLAITFQGRGHFTQVWTWRQEGKDMPTIFTLERERSSLK